MNQKIFVTFLLLLMTLKIEAFVPKSFKADITQKQKSSLSGKIKESRGKLFYRFPAQMRLEIDSPDKVVFVANKTKSWYYTAPFIDGESGEVNISEKGDHILTKFFDSFAKKLESNELYDVDKSSDAIQIKFKEDLKNELGVREARFNFKGNEKAFKEVQTLNIIQVDGREIVLELSNLELNVELSDKTFVFEIPDNTKIIQ